MTEQELAQEYYQKFWGLVKTNEDFFNLPDIPGENMAQALVYLQEASSRGHIPATAELGIAYLNGLGVPQDLDEAEALLRKAASAGEPNAMYYLYYMLVRLAGNAAEFREAFSLLHSAAELNYPPALFELGSYYFWGQSVPIGPSKGFPRDCAKAATYWKRAAELGVSEATGHLALLYFAGEGVEKNPQKALELLTKTAESDGFNIITWYNMGCLYLGVFEAFGIETGIPVDYEKALQWLTKAAEYGFLPAYHQMGVMYRQGLGVEKDDRKALYNFLMASGFDPDTGEVEEEELGFTPIVAESCYMAGLMLVLGEGVAESDEENGGALLEKAAELGVEDAIKIVKKAASLGD